MICYACSGGLGDKPFYDKPTGRFYCESCRSVIWEIIMEAEDKDEPKPKELEPGELEILDEDFDDLDIQAEDNWDSHNLPVDEDY